MPARTPARSFLAAALALVAASTSLAPIAQARRGSGSGSDRMEDAPRPSQDELQAQEANKHYQFGLQYFQQGLLRQSEESLRRAMSIQPTYPEASYLLGCVLLQLNDFRGAISQAESALAQNPFMTEAHVLVGIAYGKMGEPDRALKEFEVVKADISYPTPEVAHFNIGLILRDRGACGEGVVHLRRAIEVNPSFGRAWYMLGDCQEQLGQFDLARQSYEKSLSLQPSDVSTMYRLGFVCYQSRDWARAREMFTKVREVSPASEMAAGARDFLRQMDFR